MKVFYRSREVFEICAGDNANAEEVIKLVKEAIKNIVTLYPDEHSQKVFNLFLDEAETLEIYGRPLSAKMSTYIDIDGEKVNLVITTYYFVYPKNVFYSGDLWVQR